MTGLTGVHVTEQSMYCKVQCARVLLMYTDINREAGYVCIILPQLYDSEH